MKFSFFILDGVQGRQGRHPPEKEDLLSRVDHQEDSCPPEGEPCWTSQHCNFPTDQTKANINILKLASDSFVSMQEE